MLNQIKQWLINQEVLFGLTRDITERKQAEEKLELSERRLKEAQRIAHLGSWEMDVATGKSHWSDEFFRICGYEPGAFEPSADIGFQIIHPDDRERAAEAVTKAIEEEKVYSIEKRIVRPNGEVRHVLSQGELIHDENGQPVKMLGSFLDITERKRVEEALRESEKKYRNIIESIPLGMHMYQLEPDGRLVFTGANPAADRILGVNNTQFIGKTIEEAFPALTQTEVPEQYRRVASDGAAWQTDQIIYEENQISGAFEVYAFQTSAGKMVAAFLDITERKQAEERLKKIAAELEAANAELSQYTYVVSHDLRAPLRAIHNYADFIREDLAETLDGDLRQYLDGLGSAVCEAEELVGDLLELSRIGRMSVPVEPVDVGLFLQKQIDVLGLPDAEVEVAMAEDWPTIEVEPVLLGQIFQNLISNAVKFNRSPHKRVELGWRPVGEGRPESDSSSEETGAYEFFIRDNGIGIAPRYQEQIFRLFERLHTKQEYEGTGIGLAIVKKAVEQLHGSVRIESEPGQGSTFFVTLPRH